MATLTREQLEERLATLHRASLELVRNISLESLLERIAGLACEQADARYGAVGVLGENQQLVQFITVGMNETDIKKMAHPPEGNGLIGALMQSKKPIRLPDIASDPRSVGFPEHHPPMRSFLGVPIRQGDRQLGQIYLTEKVGAAEFSLDDQQVIETLATYAAIAISNANLYNQLVQRDRILTQRNEDLALLNELAATLASHSEDIDQILNKALSQVMDYLGLEVGQVFLRQGDTRIMNLEHHQSKSDYKLWKRTSFQLGEGMVGITAQLGHAQSVTLPENDGYDLEATLEDGPYHQVSCFPLPGRGGVLGVLCVASSQPRPFDELDMQFLTAISAWIGTVIENNRLSLQQRRIAILEERERIGMDLHDGVIQSIYAVGLTLEHARLLMKDTPERAYERIDQAMNDLNNTIRDIRAYILDLRPRQLHNDNLMQGIQRLVNEFRANTLVDVNLQGPTDGLPSLPEVQALALFHICQEALANVAKHARSRRVDVAVWTTNDRVLLEVRDDGRGFDSDNVHMTLGHGLSNMQTRARNVGGDVDISSEPKGGTTVFAWVPFQK